jgi:hypothetical protein
MGLFDLFSSPSSQLPMLEEWFKPALSAHFPTEKPNEDTYKNLFMDKERYRTCFAGLVELQPTLSGKLEQGEELLLITPLLPGYPEFASELKGLSVVTNRRIIHLNRHTDDAEQLLFSDIDGLQTVDIMGDYRNGCYYGVHVISKEALPYTPSTETPKEVAPDYKGKVLIMLLSTHGLRDEFIGAVHNAAKIHMS